MNIKIQTYNSAYKTTVALTLAPTISMSGNRIMISMIAPPRKRVHHHPLTGSPQNAIKTHTDGGA